MTHCGASDDAGRSISDGLQDEQFDGAEHVMQTSDPNNGTEHVTAVLQNEQSSGTVTHGFRRETCESSNGAFPQRHSCEIDEFAERTRIMVAATPTIWPTPAELLTWFGEVNISHNLQDGTTLTAVDANAVVQGYSQWYTSHEQASKRIVELEKEIKGADVDRSVISSLKTKIKQLEREVKAVRTAEEFKNADQLEAKLVKSQEKTRVWKERYNKLFNVTESLRDSVSTAGNGLTHNTNIHKIKPHEPIRFDGSQNLEVVTQFLNNVEHYVH